MKGERIDILDHGYIQLIDYWGSDEAIIEAARMSTNKGFKGWGTDEEPGDEKLLRFLYEHKHFTPFEMAGAQIEVKAPMMVFREWHRHRTQCLAPSTLVHFDLPSALQTERRRGYKLSLEQLGQRWAPTTRSSRPERQENALFRRQRVQEMLLRHFDEERKEIDHTRIVDVIIGDPKPMVTVSVGSGRSITATLEHKFLTSEGWLPLGDALKCGAGLLLEGTSRGQAQSWETPQVAAGEETWRDVVGWEGIYLVSDQGRVARKGCKPKKATVAPTGYLVVSLNRPGEQKTALVHRLVLEAFVGAPGDGEAYEARHLNHNRADARLENLTWGTVKQNAQDRVFGDRQQRLVGVFEDVAEVRDAGDLPTYDLTVEGPWHNFIADGFVVHNSYNEMSARYTPIPDENYIPTAERLLLTSKTNKQAGTASGADVLNAGDAICWLSRLDSVYKHIEDVYQQGLKLGVPKELARLPMPVGRFSRMRAQAVLRNWFAFIALRSAPNAQWEIRQFSNALLEILSDLFPRSTALFREGQQKSS